MNVNGSHLLGCNLKNLKTHVKHVQIGFRRQAQKILKAEKLGCVLITQKSKIAIAPLKSETIGIYQIETYLHSVRLQVSLYHIESQNRKIIEGFIFHDVSLLTLFM